MNALMGHIVKQIVFNKNVGVRSIFSGMEKLQQHMENANKHSNGMLPVTTLSEDELMMKQTVSKLASEQIAPHVRKMEAAGKIDDGVMKLLFKNGLMGVEVDPQYGGAGCNFMTMMLVVEELSKVDPSVGALVDIHSTLCNAMLTKYGTKEQKEKYLIRMATDTCASFALTEPSSGTDAFALKTTAKRDGSDYVINGSKMWISNSDVAGIFIVFVNADPSAGYKGISAFIMDRNIPGLTVARPENKLGICASGTCMVSFDNVRVPASALLGEFGKGYKYAATILNEGRIGIGAQMIGLAQGCFDATIPYTLERHQFGKPIFSFQGMQHQIADVATRIETARLLVYNTARMLEAGEEYTKQSAMAKYYAAEVAQHVCIKCIDWMGGVGFTKDFIQEKFYRDVKIGSIYEGTYNIQLSTIAKFIGKEYQ